MKRFFLILTLVAATFTFTGCEEKTGTTTYHRQNGDVTQVNRYRNPSTNKTVFRTRKMSGQQYQSEQNYEQLGAAGLAVLNWCLRK